MPVGFNINWHITDFAIEQNPLYIKWSTKTLAQVISAKSDLITDMNSALMNKDSAVIMSYLSWLARTANAVIELGA